MGSRQEPPAGCHSPLTIHHSLSCPPYPHFPLPYLIVSDYKQNDNRQFLNDYPYLWQKKGVDIQYKPYLSVIIVG
jgi:hypothetical protein